VLIVLGGVLLVGFVLVETRAAEPILPPAIFGNRVVAVTSAVGFVVGIALFGSITFLPLYLQNVKGHSPTISGLLLTPLVAGVLVTSIGGGNLISRTGHCRPVPIIGTALMAIGLALLSRLRVGSPALTTSAYMVVVGLGLGSVMQVLVLAAQNAVDYQYLGVVSSGATLFRQIGGSIGVSVFGAIFADQLARNLAGKLPAGRACRRRRTRPRSSSSHQLSVPLMRARSRRRCGRSSCPLRGSPWWALRSHGSSRSFGSGPRRRLRGLGRASPRLATTTRSERSSGRSASWRVVSSAGGCIKASPPARGSTCLHRSSGYWPGWASVSRSAGSGWWSDCMSTLASSPRSSSATGAIARRRPGRPHHADGFGPSGLRTPRRGKMRRPAGAPRRLGP
jgi:Major Facilitator Superfamily